MSREPHASPSSHPARGPRRAEPAPATGELAPRAVDSAREAADSSQRAAEAAPRGEAFLPEGDLRLILSEVPRPAPASAISASLTLGWRALLKMKHVPFQLFDVTAFPLMMTLLFTYLFGGALAGSPREYIQFLLPGILIQAVLFVTVYTGMGLNQDIDKGLFERFRSLPIWQPAPMVGALLGDVMRYSVAALMVLGLGLALGFRPGAGLVGVFLAYLLVLVFAFSLSWIWIVLGLVVETQESVMTTSFLVLFPLTFVSNIFVDPVTMPSWLQAVVAVNPVTHLVTACRGLMHGGVALSEVAWVLAASAVLVAAFAPLALRMYHKER